MLWEHGLEALHPWERKEEIDNGEELVSEDSRLIALFRRNLEAYRNGEIPVESHTYDELVVGQEVTEKIEITKDLIKFFGIATGDVNLAHMDEQYAATTKFQTQIMHGVFTDTIISKLLGTKLPGLGTIYLEKRNQKFLGTVKPGDILEVYVRVAEKGEKGRVLFNTGSRVNGEDIVTGQSLVIAPREKAASPSTYKRPNQNIRR